MLNIHFSCGLSARALCSETSPELIYSVHDDIVSFTLSAPHQLPLSDHLTLAEMSVSSSADSRVLGDGFQMLAQTGGSFARPEDIGRCPDNNESYRIYPMQDTKRYYNYLVIQDEGMFTLFGFTSCYRFAGYFEWHQNKVVACLDGENIILSGRSSQHDLESFTVLQSIDLTDLFKRYSKLINQQHAPRAGVKQAAPIGWCSWYAYYANVSEQHIQDNVTLMTAELDALEWVLLDDGYQAFMGDWLTPSAKFSGGVKKVISAIKAQGKKPAIWLAPFIAQPESALFQQHPDWFVKDVNGHLLKAEDVTYGGWRCTPWYILDTSHPDVCQHLSQVVSIMREEWGVELFKLDANYWGTLKGVRYQPQVSGVEAYRLGMQAIAAGAGNAWLLGCNAPMWPSLGLVDAMRVSDDVERHSGRFAQIAKESFSRSWQHRQLWQIDPDCATFVSLTEQATDIESYHFHRDVLLACGGLLLSGDPLDQLNEFALQSLQALIARQTKTQVAAGFDSLDLHQGRLDLQDGSYLHFLFNYPNDDRRDVVIKENCAVDWFDFWTGESLAGNSQYVAAAKQLALTLPAGLVSRVILSRCR
jgi:alpha-galactosidase